MSNNRETNETDARILVVEDNEETLNVISRTLASGGHDVMWARTATDALELLNKGETRLSLIIVDVVLPGMSGPDLVKLMSLKYPTTDALYVSAYDKHTVRARGVDPDTMPFLSKPYEPRDLLEIVDKLLRRGDGS